ncbi:hypothetical protein [Teredinibacter haidensis]|uniref:hypothetical protein n=1 Tax=Teredinibacter haidensis TaxID=2731755 RepID=UPI00163CC9C1|nr:hypothetical protein [Teredinibacter haidensis]
MPKLATVGTPVALAGDFLYRKSDAVPTSIARLPHKPAINPSMGLHTRIPAGENLWSKPSIHVASNGRLPWKEKRTNPCASGFISRRKTSSTSHV